MRRGTCESCRAPILWVKLASGANTCLDPDPVPHGNVYRTVSPDGAEVFRVVSKALPAPPGELLYVSHFATCPNAARHRKRKAPPAHVRRARSER